jgi:beta-glucanase (GH16 family)
VWQEEFNTGSSPDPDVWTLQTGYGPGGSGWGNDEWQLYTEENVDIVYEDASDPANGYLRITAELDTEQCPSPGPPPGCGKRDGSITSARLISLPGVSRTGKSFRYGRISASIKFAGGVGSWPAFWMLGEKFPVTGWPKAGEIDIAEMFNSGGLSNQEALFALHWCDESLEAGQCSPFPTGYRTISARRDIGFALPSDFVVYEAEWTPNGVVWRVDGVTYYSYPIAPATMEEFLEEFFLLLNVAIGGNPVPAPDAAGWPRTMLVDWIRLYQ